MQVSVENNNIYSITIDGLNGLSEGERNLFMIRLARDVNELRVNGTQTIIVQPQQQSYWKWLKVGRDLILPICAVIGSIASVYLAVKANK